MTNKAGNNPAGDYLLRSDTPDPCSMGVMPNRVQHAGWWNYTWQAIEILCGRNSDLTERVETIENNGGGGEGDGCPDYCGNGSPEGVVTAAIGSSYMQYDAVSTAHSRWVKFSNAGNTGWRRWNGLAGASGASGTGYRIGDGSVATGTHSLAFGDSTNGANDYTIDIGYGNTIPVEASVLGFLSLGFRNAVDIAGNTLDGEIVVGFDNDITHDWSSAPTSNVVIGNTNVLFGDAIMIFGNQNNISGPGTGSSAEGVIVGFNITADASSCFVGVGHDVTMGSGSGETAIGTHTIVNGSLSTVVGSQGEATGDNITAIGGGVLVSNHDSIGIGIASVSGQKSIAIGNGATVTSNQSIAIGYAAADPGANKMRIGSASAPIDEITVYTSSGLKTVTLV